MTDTPFQDICRKLEDARNAHRFLDDRRIVGAGYQLANKHSEGDDFKRQQKIANKAMGDAISHYDGEIIEEARRRLDQLIKTRQQEVRDWLLEHMRKPDRVVEEAPVEVEPEPGPAEEERGEEKEPPSDPGEGLPNVPLF